MQGDKRCFVLNETAVKSLELESPLGKVLKDTKKNEWTIIGVVKDFHFKSLHYEIQPICHRN